MFAHHTVMGDTKTNNNTHCLRLYESIKTFLMMLVVRLQTCWIFVHFFVAVLYSAEHHQWFFCAFFVCASFLALLMLFDFIYLFLELNGVCLRAKSLICVFFLFLQFLVPYVTHIKWVVYITRVRSLKENEPNKKHNLGLIHTKTEAHTKKNRTEIINIWLVYTKKISIKIR